MKEFIFSDMACETQEASYFSNSEDVTDSERFRKDVQFFERDADRACVITYLTPPLWQLDEKVRRDLIRSLSSDLAKLMKKNFKSTACQAPYSVLAVGLGNRELTPDALGAETVRKIWVSRPLQQTFRPSSGCFVSALAPNVSANTGIESAEIIGGVAEKIHPHLILAVDALATQSCSRLGAAVQLSELGIRPGSGLGNFRSALNRESMGIPVLSLGVPTVVHSSTMIIEALCRSGMSELTDKMRAYLKSSQQFYVTPKETDLILKEVSALLATVINRACHLVGHNGRWNGIQFHEELFKKEEEKR